jgi:cytidylate kinase
MNKRVVLCISREYGSGGRVVGEQVATQLGITCYDKKLIAKTAMEHGVPEEMIRKVDEQPINWLTMGFPMGIRNPYNAEYYDAMYYVMNDRVFSLQAETIKSIAAQGSCVIVGRVAEEVLKDDPDMVSVFIHAAKENRIKRIMDVERVDHQTAEKLVRKTDKNRSNYHNYYSRKTWGECSSYDFSISTSKFGIEGTVKAILKLLE